MRRVSVPSDIVAIVGVGASPLIRELVAEGYSTITAVDISQCALDELSVSLGADVAKVCLLRDDVRTVRLPSMVDVWHDRATFHFLTDAADQAAYASAAAEHVRAGGHLVLAEFAQGGPTSCSGLPVARHSTRSLTSVFGSEFDLVESFERDHLTPSGSTQRFLHALMTRRHDRQ